LCIFVENVPNNYKSFDFLLMLLTAANLIAQSVSYTYDNAGNRIARVILMSKSPAAPVEAITALPINFP